MLWQFLDGFDVFLDGLKVRVIGEKSDVRNKYMGGLYSKIYIYIRDNTRKIA